MTKNDYLSNLRKQYSVTVWKTNIFPKMKAVRGFYEGKSQFGYLKFYTKSYPGLVDIYTHYLDGYWKGFCSVDWKNKSLKEIFKFINISISWKFRTASLSRENTFRTHYLKDGKMVPLKRTKNIPFFANDEKILNLKGPQYKGLLHGNIKKL